MSTELIEKVTKERLAGEQDEAVKERDKLGFAVVNVIGKLDEINEQVEEITLHDFNYFALPAELWHELQDALEEMPERAELYTSTISKEAYDGAREDLAIWKKRALEAEEWVGLTDDDIKGLPQPNYDITTAQYVKLIEAKLKQLNVPEKG